MVAEQGTWMLVSIDKDFQQSKEGKGKEGGRETTLEAFELSGMLDQLGIVFRTQSLHFILFYFILHTKPSSSSLPPPSPPCFSSSHSTFTPQRG